MSRVCRVLVLVTCLSLTSGVLLLGQLFAWSNMASERSDELGYIMALLDSVNGPEMCGLCEIVSELGQEKSDTVHVRELAFSLKTVASEESAVSLAVPSCFFGSLDIDPVLVPDGLERSVLKAPPRLLV